MRTGHSVTRLVIRTVARLTVKDIAVVIHIIVSSTLQCFQVLL